MFPQSAASHPCLPRTDDSRGCLPGNALSSLTRRQGCCSACSYAKGQRLDDAVQTLVQQEAPFPGILAGQGRHDLARLVMQQLLQVRECAVHNCTYTPVGQAITETTKMPGICCCAHEILLACPLRVSCAHVAGLVEL